jgi:hypothetical protein
MNNNLRHNINVEQQNTCWCQHILKCSSNQIS